MSCCNKSSKNCKYNIKTYGTCDVSHITLEGNDRTTLNWSEISVPEIMQIPDLKPDIEHLDQVYVDAAIDCTKLIETPFAYKPYPRLATDYEIATVGDIVTAATAISITAVVTAVNAVLAVATLPVIPEVAALQDALTAVQTAFTNLTTALTNLNLVLAATCVLAYAVVAAVKALQAALLALQVALAALLAAANALLAALLSAFPLVYAIVAPLVATLTTAVNAVVADVVDVLSSILSVLAVFGFTYAFEIIPNEEGTYLSGRKLIVQGYLKQKVVYTALVSTQTVHSACRIIPFSAYIIPYASFTGLTYKENLVVVTDEDTCDTAIINGFLFDPEESLVVNLDEDFTVDACIEDIFAYAVDTRNIFKNITLFLYAKPQVV